MKKSLGVLVCLTTVIALAQTPPKTMTRVEVVLHGPDAPPGSFAAKPKVMYRAGDVYCRIEEAPDPEQGIHSLMIVNEPDYWTVNLLAKTARHGTDPGPTFNCHLPIYAYGTPQSLDEETKQIRQLEFGRELEFFKNRGAEGEKGPVLEGIQTTQYRARIGASALSLFTSGSPEHPVAVALRQGDRNEVFWYRSYGWMEFDKKLFEKPDNVKIEGSIP